ncbi:MAG: efflux RND transporter periplasmic adaptor subunit [Pseudomonadota bacterium]
MNMSADLSQKLHALSIVRPDEGRQGRSFPWGVVTTAFILGAAVSGAIGWYQFHQLGTSAPIRAGRVDPGLASLPAKAMAPRALIAAGYVVARRRASVASEVSGRLLQVRVEEGQRVAKGQIIAVVDSSLAQGELNTARARVGAAEAGVRVVDADIADARRVLQRTQELSAKGFLSAAELNRDEARLLNLEAQLMRSKSDLGAARAEVARNQVQLSKYEIRSPFEGVVVDKTAQAGESVSPMSAGGGSLRSGICTLVDMNSLEIEADVNEAFIGRVFEGQTVNAVMDAYPDSTIAGRVLAIVPAANRDKATVRVRIGFIRHDPRLLPDMGIKVTLRDKTL